MDQSANSCCAITHCMEDHTEDVTANNLQQLPTVSFPEANFQILNWHFVFIPCHITHGEFVDFLLYNNICWIKLRRRGVSLLKAISWAFPSTLLELLPDEELTPAPHGCSPVKNTIPFHSDLIIGEWHVLTYPLIHSLGQSRPESLSLVNARLVVERLQVAGSSGSNLVALTSPPSVKGP